MKPEKLILEGVYSYKNRTEIDFSTLCDAELFGIFGNVGSGKSAILEAVTYVLYGKIERLSSRIYYNMMNLASNRMYIEFIFTRAGERFRFTFETKRSKKDFNKIETPRRSAGRMQDGEWLPLFDKDNEVTADEIIGLNYDNFRRTIIVPQGRFQEFLHLEKTKRTAMLMELFSLGRFDLFSKTAMLSARTNEEAASVTGELSGLEDATAEALEKNRSELEQISLQASALSGLLEAGRLRLNSLQELAGLYSRLGAAEAEFADINSSSDSCDEKKAALRQYESCRAEFKSSLDIINLHEDEKRSLAEDFETASLGLEAARLRKREAEAAYERAESDYSEIDRLKIEAGWYEQLAVVESERSRAAGLRKLIFEKDSGLEELKRRSNELSAALEQGLAELQRTAAGEMTIDEMRSLSELYRALADCEANLESLKPELDSLNTGKTQLSCRLEEYAALSDEESELEERMAGISRRKIDAEIMKGLGALALGLEDGKPCPVCGSTEHPDPAVDRDAGSVHDEALISAEEVSAAELSAELKVRREEFLSLNNELAAMEGRIESSSSALEQAELSRTKLIEAFPEGRFGPGDSIIFREEYDQFVKAARRREQLQNETTRLSGEQRRLNSDVMALSTEINNLRIGLKEAETKVEAAESDAGSEFTEDCAGLDSVQLKRAGSDIRSRIESYAALFTEAELERKNAGLQNEKYAAEYSIAERRLEDVSRKLVSAENELDKQIKSAGFGDRTEILSILSKDLDIDSERASIEAFEKRREAAVAAVEQLKNEIGGRRYSTAEHERESAGCRELEEQINSNIERQGELGNILKDLMARLERRKLLEHRMDALRTRSENLTVMKNLFRGNKFVDYAATVYLQELCAAANARFRKLTQESLRLELDENNNFIIRDYLNDGKTRSVKTLSGGQTFQAAFSLSLSLADSIGRERSGFFFLDEGFGSLDRESLALVFDSLKSLKKENRTVGVISHVEELKQEIDTFISVTKDHEKGSIIRCSWSS